MSRRCSRSRVTDPDNDEIQGKTIYRMTKRKKKDFLIALKKIFVLATYYLILISLNFSIA